MKTYALLVRIVFCALIFFPDGVAAQQVNVSEDVTHYEIVGRKAEELLREMELKGPPSSFGGPRYFANAETYYRWEFEADASDELCALENYYISVNIHYMLPFWKDQSRARKRLVKYWEQFGANLWVHEKGHGDVAIAVAVKIAEAIGGVDPQPTCEGVFEKAKTAADEVLRSDRSHKEYDSATKHGRTQGAFFDVAVAKGRRRR